MANEKSALLNSSIELIDSIFRPKSGHCSKKLVNLGDSHLEANEETIPTLTVPEFSPRSRLISL